MEHLPAGQCHWCNSWKDNAFGLCSNCHRFQPPKYKKENQMTIEERNNIQASIIKYLFIVLKHVRFFVTQKFSFTNCNLIEVRNLVHDAYQMTLDPDYKSQDHPDLELNEMIAAILYKLGIPENATQSIDECNIMYGYGKCFDEGYFLFTIAHRFLKPGMTLRTYPSFACELDSKKEFIMMHAWKEVA